MNCPSRTDDSQGHPDWNQNPSDLSADLTTRADLNGMINLRNRKAADSDPSDGREDDDGIANTPQIPEEIQERTQPRSTNSLDRRKSNLFRKALDVLIRYAQFVGPGFLISVAYIDPGNYATDVSAGASTQYKLLFIVLMSNLFAIFLQALCIKLGSVTGLNLAEMCRAHLPKWLTIILYIFAEVAIIATDMAEVIGSAIALNLLLHIPLVAGVALTIVDVLLLLLFYKPDGSMTRLRVFECFVMVLVLGVMVCFCIQLSYIRNTSIRTVFAGYLPSSAIIRSNGLYLSCGILGATVMPHSIFLGSGIVQPRLRQFDIAAGLALLPSAASDAEEKYRPSIQAIRSCLAYSITELSTSLFTFALFINSAILIVAGSALYDPNPNSAAANADLFAIHDLLSRSLAPAAGTVFALALLLSGTSAGIVCTMAGQMVSEGMLAWSISPLARRLLTRTISITPSIIIAASIGKAGLNTALTASQVVLSVILPFVSAPLLYFTCRGKYMTVVSNQHDGAVSVNMKNGWITTVLAVLIWAVLVVMNVALLVLVAVGKA